MEGQFIDVCVEISEEKITMLAKIISEHDSNFHIRFMSETKRSHEDQIVYDFDDEITEISKETVSGYYDSSDPIVAGYIFIPGVGYLIKEDFDEDYSPSDNDEE